MVSDDKGIQGGMGVAGREEGTSSINRNFVVPCFWLCLPDSFAHGTAHLLSLPLRQSKVCVCVLEKLSFSFLDMSAVKKVKDPDSQTSSDESKVF